MNAVDCLHCLERLPELVGGSVSEAEARGLHLHLQACPACAAAHREWQQLAGMLSGQVSALMVPPADRALAKAWDSPQRRGGPSPAGTRWGPGLLGALTALGLLVWWSAVLPLTQGSPPGSEQRPAAGPAGPVAVTDPRGPRAGGSSLEVPAAAAPPGLRYAPGRPAATRPWDAEPQAASGRTAALPQTGPLAQAVQRQGLRGPARLAGAGAPPAPASAAPAAPGAPAGGGSREASPPAGWTAREAPPAGGPGGGPVPSEPPAEPGQAPPTEPVPGPSGVAPTPLVLPTQPPTSQPPPAPADPTVPAVSELLGEVVDEEGEPIPGALLQFWVEPEQAGQPLVHLQDADAEGRFSVRLPAGAYHLRGEAPGHEPAWWGGPDRERAGVLHLPMEPASPPLRLVLRRLPLLATPSAPPQGETASPPPGSLPTALPSTTPWPPLSGSWAGQAGAPPSGGFGPPGQRRAAS